MRAEAEGAGDIPGLLADGEPGLGPGGATPGQQVREHPGMQHAGNLPREDFRLIVPAFPAAAPVQRDGDDGIHAGERRRPGQLHSEQPAEAPACRDRPFVFQSLRNLPVPRVGVVEEQGRRPGIGLLRHTLPNARFSGRRCRQPLLQVPLDEEIEAVGHGIVGQFPVVGQRQVRPAEEAQVPLAGAENPAAGEAGPRDEQVAEGGQNGPERKEGWTGKGHGNGTAGKTPRTANIGNLPRKALVLPFPRGRFFRFRCFLTVFYRQQYRPPLTAMTWPVT